jgi:hypothetical protein
VAQVTTPEPETPQNAPEVANTDCLSELLNYDWPIEQAKSIMMIESENDPSIINDNPATGDYSIGCFQVNILGNLANNRPSKDQLLDPKINIKWAYNHYIAMGRTFCTTGGWYNSCKKAGL